MFIPYAMVFLSRYPMGPMASGELCARTLPRVLPSLRPALVAGYQRPGGAAGDGWRSGKTCGKRWANVGVSREKYVDFTDFTGKCRLMSRCRRVC